MALQGTLETFALPDVLRLLASTKKTGCYRLDGDRGSGQLWVRDGQLVAGSFSSAPQVSAVDEITFELLRFRDGDFVFDADAEPDEAGDPADVEATLEAAEQLLEEWQEIEAVVPSLDVFVSLRAELPSDEVTIRADRWIYVVAIGGGTSVGRLGAMLGQGELPICRTVKELVELGVVELGDAPAGADVFVSEPEPVVAFEEPAPVIEPVAEPAFESFDSADGGIQFGAFDDVPVAEVEEEEAEAGLGDGGFEPFDPNALVIEDSDGVEGDEGAFASFEPEDEAAPAAPAPDASDAAEIARQLANLSPKAAKAVAAAAKATTVEEREAALAAVDDEEDPINRELLLKFLGSVNS